MRVRAVVAGLGGLAFCIGIFQHSIPPLAQSQETNRTGKAAEAAPLEPLRASAEEFERAFNKGDARAIAAQFTEEAEVVDEDGNVVRGRADIEARFSGLFQEFPQASIEIEVVSLRQVGENVAVEDGVSVTRLGPDVPPSRSPYTVIHLKRDGKWLVASVRDFPEQAAATPHDHLMQLEWLVGEWVDESDEGLVQTTCRWSDDGNYLLQDFVIKARKGAVMKGTQRIGWDALRRTVRSWAFDHSGVFTEATWTPVEGAWILTVDGVIPDGQRVSMTRVVTPIAGDSYHIDTSSFVVGNEALPDTSIRVVRRPPAPTK